MIIIIFCDFLLVNDFNPYNSLTISHKKHSKTTFSCTKSEKTKKNFICLSKYKICLRLNLHQIEEFASNIL